MYSNLSNKLELCYKHTGHHFPFNNDHPVIYPFFSWGFYLMDEKENGRQ